MVGFGELLLRLDTPGHSRFSQLDQFQAKFTGGEANVLVAAKHFGVENCSIVSKVPSHAIGDACLQFLNRYGINTEFVARGGERLGILFVESGSSLRPSRVIYDRKHTGFRDGGPAEYDWDSVLREAAILHITGTAPALGPNVVHAMDDAIKAARNHGCLVSFDCSFRSALWGVEEAGKAYRDIARQVDILFASPGDATLFFGIDDTNEQRRMEILAREYELGYLAYTSRDEISATKNKLAGFCLHNGDWAQSDEYEFEIIDRIGSGDAFAGGILASLIKGESAKSGVDFATAAAVLKHTVPGDFCLVAETEVLELLRGDGLRIRR